MPTETGVTCAFDYSQQKEFVALLILPLVFYAVGWLRSYFRVFPR
jgi:hypothetical protein